MTSVGFTGTRQTAGEEERIIEYLDETLGGYEPGKGHEFTTGACVGFDAIAARYCLEHFPEATHRLIVPANRSQIDTDLFHEFLTATIPGRIEIILMPEGTTYEDRNREIVRFTYNLVSVADYPEEHGKSKRSGTWQTIRMARRELLHIWTLTLNYKENEVTHG